MYSGGEPDMDSEGEARMEVWKAVLPFDHELLTIQELAAATRFSERHLRNLARSGRLPAFKLGSKVWRISKTQLLDRLAEGGCADGLTQQPQLDG